MSKNNDEYVPFDANAMRELIAAQKDRRNGNLIRLGILSNGSALYMRKSDLEGIEKEYFCPTTSTPAGKTPEENAYESIKAAIGAHLNSMATKHN